MKILLINEFIKMGGAELQTFREYDLFSSMGHKVFILTFDKNYPKSIKGHLLNLPVSFNKMQKIFVRFLGSKKHGKEIRRVINQISPDVIHINNVFNLSKEIYDAARPYPTVQTIRDFSVICPKGVCVKDDGKYCMGYLHDNCKKCIGFSAENQIKRILLKKVNKIRMECIDKFISPSEALAKCCTNNGIPTKCINNPFDFSKITAEEKDFTEKKIYLYYGIIAEHKGVSKLFEAFEVFSKGKNVELWLIGKVHPTYCKKFERLLNSEYAVYLGEKDNDEIMKLYHKIYCVIVPSLWLENYPNVVLEAIGNKTLVIGSNRGGIPELIQDDRYVFDILKQKSFVKCLKMTYILSKPEYKAVTEKAYMRIQNNNSLDKYYERLSRMYKNVIEDCD